MAMDGAELLSSGPILLYDGSCGVCSRTVQWILGHEQSKDLRFAPLDSDVGGHLRALAHVPLDVDSLLWIEMKNGKVHAELRSSAALRVAEYVGGGWRLLKILRLVPRVLRDLGYRAFAAVRHNVAAKSCLVPTPQERQRFLGVF